MYHFGLSISAIFDLASINSFSASLIFLLYSFLLFSSSSSPFFIFSLDCSSAFLAFSILALMFDKSRTFSLVTLNSFLAFSIACFTSLAKVELYTLIFICLEILGLAIEVIVSVVSPLFLPVTFNPSIVTILSLLDFCLMR